MPAITVQGRQAHYREWGNGETTLLVLHGWPADSSHYDVFAPLLAKHGYRLIVPDFPGFGGSEAPSAAWSVSDYKTWVHEFAAALRLKQFVLFGHSFGGRVAIKYVLAYPYEVRALILCAAAGIRPDPYTLKRRILYGLAKAGNAFFSIPGLHALSPFARRLLYRAAGSNDYLQAQGVAKETIKRVLSEDLSPLLPEIKHPTLLLWGSEDTATPLADGQAMAKAIPHATLQVFAGQRHNLPKLIPQPLAEAVAEFIASERVQTISE